MDFQAKCIIYRHSLLEKQTKNINDWIFIQKILFKGRMILKPNTVPPKYQ